MQYGLCVGPLVMAPTWGSKMELSRVSSPPETSRGGSLGLLSFSSMYGLRDKMWAPPLVTTTPTPTGRGTTPHSSPSVRETMT